MVNFFLVFFGVFFFLESILWCSQSGDVPYEDLAKFGYKLNLKNNLLYFRLHTWTMYRNLANFITFGQILAIENLKRHVIFSTLKLHYIYI